MNKEFHRNRIKTEIDVARQLVAFLPRNTKGYSSAMDLILSNTVGQCAKSKLNIARLNGHDGWWDRHIAELTEKLSKSVEEGSYLDAVNYASMLFMRKEVLND